MYLSISDLATFGSPSSTFPFITDTTYTLTTATPYLVANVTPSGFTSTIAYSVTTSVMTQTTNLSFY